MKKPRILTVGSTNMDFVCTASRLPGPGETLLSEGSYFFVPGGKGANGAIAAARLDADVVFCTCVGKDAYGKQLFDTYAKEGIDGRFIFFDSDAKTGLAQIFRTDDGENRITVFPGANRSLRAENVEEAFTCYPDAVLMQCEIEPEVVAYAARTASDEGIPLFFDLAPMRRDFDPSIIPACEILSPNESEAEFYTGIHLSDEESCLRAAMKLYAMVPCKYVVIKRGSLGCYIYDGTYREIIPALKVRPVDTTGAGDAFTAALMVRYLLNGGDIMDAARFANCVGAYSVTVSGAFASFPTTAKLETFINEYNRR